MSEQSDSLLNEESIAKRDGPSKWPLVLFLSLLMGLFWLTTVYSAPLPLDRIDLGFWRILRIILACAVIVLIPGLPWARIAFRKHETNSGQVLGFGIVLNVVFYFLLINLLRILDVEVTYDLLFNPAVCFTLFGLIVYLLIDIVEISSKERKSFFLELLIGCTLLLILSFLFRNDVLRPSYRYFLNTEVLPFLSFNSPLNSKATYGSGFSNIGEGQYEIAESGGEIQFNHAKGIYPFRAILFGPLSEVVNIQVNDNFPSKINIGKKRSANHPDKKQLDYLPQYGGVLLSLDVPSSGSNSKVRIWSTTVPYHHLMVEDYSNFDSNCATKLFLHRNSQDNFQLVAEPFERAKLIEEVLDSSYQPPVGYYMSDLALHFGGYMLFSLVVLFLTMILVCYLMACSILREFLGPDSRIACYFPAIQMIMAFWATVIREKNPHGSDSFYAAFLLIALLMYIAKKNKAFILASFPASMVRFPGIVLLTVYQMSCIIIGPSRKARMRTLGVYAIFWVIIFSMIITHVSMFWDWTSQLEVLHREIVTEHFDSKYLAGTDLAIHIIKTPLKFFLTFFGVTGGLVVFLLLPRSYVGRQFLILIGFYSATLMYVISIQYRHYLPLMFFVSIGAGWNILSSPFHYRKKLIVASIVLSSFIVIVSFFGSS